ncbi:hypothetical protein GCM10028781_15440 [Nostocoides australiense]
MQVEAAGAGRKHFDGQQWGDGEIAMTEIRSPRDQHIGLQDGVAAVAPGPRGSFTGAPTAGAEECQS